MLGTGIEAGQDSPGLGGDDGRLVVIPGEFADRVERIEAHDGDEFHFVAAGAAEQLDALEAAGGKGEKKLDAETLKAVREALYGG